MTQKNTLRLRALVSERLTAAAEEIFALVERTIVEYEEELCRSKEENQRKQQLLDSLLIKRNQEPQTDISVSVPSPEEDEPIGEEKNESAMVKEEPKDLCCMKSVCAKRKVSPSPPLKTEKPIDQCDRVKSQVTIDTFQQSAKNSNVWYKLWELPTRGLHSTSVQMETEANGDHSNKVHSKDTRIVAHNPALFSKYKSGAESVRTEQGEIEVDHEQIDKTAHTAGLFAFRNSSSESLYMSNAKIHVCSFCEKRFTTNQSLQIHIRVHTGEKPYSCPFCKKCFTQKPHLKTHIRTHTKEKPYRCSVCLKSFMHKVSLNLHVEKTHSEFVG